MIQIYIDADGCAVKDEVYKVAERYQLVVFVVANKWFEGACRPTCAYGREFN